MPVAVYVCEMESPRLGDLLFAIGGVECVRAWLVYGHYLRTVVYL